MCSYFLLKISTFSYFCISVQEKNIPVPIRNLHWWKLYRRKTQIVEGTNLSKRWYWDVCCHTKIIITYQVVFFSTLLMMSVLNTDFFISPHRFIILIAKLTQRNPCKSHWVSAFSFGSFLMPLLWNQLIVTYTNISKSNGWNYRLNYENTGPGEISRDPPAS